MLTKLTDVKGVEWWINPIHVKLIREKRGKSEVHMASPSVWGNQSPSLRVPIPADELAAVLNAAMPDMAFVPEDEGGMDDSGGAAAATMIG